MPANALYSPQQRCPNCGATPFERLDVPVRALFWSGWWRRCVICRACKEIVGYEKNRWV